MRIVGMTRVKNEARWIERAIRAALDVCEQVVVFDDHSTDGTDEICAAIDGVLLVRSPFEGLDEARDKNTLLSQLNEPDYVLHFDGDEELAAGGADLILGAIREHRYADAWRLPVVYLWDSPEQMRTDGVYGTFTRPSLFRYVQGRQFGATVYGGNFHCGNVPGPVTYIARCAARLMHYGYMDRADRLRKFAWYNEHDPGNDLEDHYRHIVQGDVPDIPATATLKHAGPLNLRPFTV